VLRDTVCYVYKVIP